MDVGHFAFLMIYASMDNKADGGSYTIQVLLLKKLVIL